MRRPGTSLPAFPLMVGALASAIIFTGAGPWAIAVGLLLVLSSAIFIAAKPGRGILYLAVGSCISACTALYHQPPSAPVGNIVTATATVENAINGRVGINAIIDVTQVNGAVCKPFKARLGIAEQSLDLQPGDIITVSGVFEPCDKLSSIPHMGAAAQASKADGLFASIFVRDNDIKIIGIDNSLRYRLGRLRTRIADACYASHLSPLSSSLLVSATLGTGDAALEIKERFRATGLAHLLCVSGFHVGLVAWLLSIILWPVKIWPHAGRLRYFALIMGVWLFAALTGAATSALRAATMITAFYLAKLLERQASPYNSLALAIGILVAINPFAIYSIGFQLSVSAVLGLLVFAHRLNPFPIRRHTLYLVGSFVTVPFAAMIGTAPIILYWFHRLPLFSVPVNAIVSLIFPLFIGISTIAIASGWSWATHVADNLSNTIVRICDEAINLDSGLSDIFMSPAALIGLSAVIITCGIAININNLKLKAALLVIPTIAIPLLTIPPERIDTEIIVAGNTNGNQIIIRDSTSCKIFCSRRKLPVVMDAYIRARGIDATTQPISPFQKLITLNEIKIGYAEDNTYPDTPVDILMVGGRYKGDIDTLLDICQPEKILIGADATPTLRTKIEEAGRKRSISLHHLATQAFYLRP